MSIFKRNKVNTDAEKLNNENKGRTSSKIINYLRNRISNTFEKNNNIENILAQAKKNGALVEEIKPGEYQVTQKKQMIHGKLSNLNYNENNHYVKIVSHYKENSNTSNKPIDEIKYYNDMGHELPVVKRITRDGDDINLYILDRGSKLGVEFSGYDEKGNALLNKEQSIRIFGKDNNTIHKLSGEDINNALLSPEYNEDDRYSHKLLDVKYAVSSESINWRILDWQADNGIESLIKMGQQFRPENFIKINKSDNTNEYKNYLTETPAFIKNLDNYNEFAKTRNLRIEEENNVLKFKDSKDQVVREITTESNKQEIKYDTFSQLREDGDLYQSATRDKNGKIVSRTINEFRQRWGKASTVTIDYKKGKAKTGLYIKGELSDVKDVDIEYGEYMFRDIARRKH